MFRTFFLLAALYTCYVYSYNDLVSYDISSQAKCTEVTRGPTRDCRWPAGLNMADYVVEKGRIIAYKIQWSGGSWSQWFVNGVNDLDIKYNTFTATCGLSYKKNSMRHWWSYFYDHNHMFIICKPE